MTQESRTSRLTLPVSQRDHRRDQKPLKVTVVECGDYECPSCGEAYPIIKEIKLRLGDRLRFVFRNFPLTQIHPHAEHTAEADAGQGKFWQMHDSLFEHQQALDDVYVVHSASELHLHDETFKREMTEHVHTHRVHEDFLSGV